MFEVIFQVSIAQQAGWGSYLPVLSTRGSGQGSPSLFPVPGGVQLVSQLGQFPFQNIPQVIPQPPQAPQDPRIGIKFGLVGIDARDEGNDEETSTEIGGSTVETTTEVEQSTVTDETPEDTEESVVTEIISEEEGLSINEEEENKPCCDNLSSNTITIEDDNKVETDILPTATGAESERVEGDKKCVEKIMMVEKIEFDREVQCDHSYEEKCFKSTTTVYEPYQKEECDEDFIRDCFIDYEKTATENNIKVCNKKMIKDCGEEESVGYGREETETICSTYYQSECVTSQQEHQVIFSM